ncbi:DUF342 domain-containing protein [Pseudalkalibacillus berkeleyi]|uniref:FapA family protein n=1 Tax=Pseudalkalibacillus berkeleyi TaxID=1069813 RepID=A0ABS9GZW5_9BACL|nr:FapA family protein [Pseudalkalibacillus berkeleyi]MCF6137133.1 FapA family protein [Pseudalkalibacillus berkeleyi]
MGIDLISESVQLKVKENGMSAILVPTSSVKEAVTLDALLDFLTDNQIIYGINLDVLESIVVDLDNWNEPIKIAEGMKPVDGEPGYISPVLNETESTNLEARFVDLRSPTRIQSVKKGDLIAKIVPHTLGTDGMNVMGEKVVAKPGKPLQVKETKHTKVDFTTNKIIARSDGQVSYQKRSVHVFPVYEVNSDLDLNTGNLSFTGNIHIHGDVPSGYTISADGDVRIAGSVEASDIQAGGSIFIRDGISGQGKGTISAGCDVRTGYINQGSVTAGGDLHTGLINHSYVQVDGSVFCEKDKGIIHGGSISAGVNVHVKQAGNELMSKTQFYFGVPQHVIRQSDHLSSKVKEEEENLKKLLKLQSRIEQKNEDDRTTQERVLLLKIKNTFNQSENLVKQLQSELDIVREDFVEVTNHSLFVRGVVFPGVETTFGKYKRVLKSEYKAVEMKLVSGEVIIKHL